MTLVAVIIVLVYLVFIGSLVLGFGKVRTFTLGELKPVTKFSIIVPFRNEQKHLENLLRSIDRLNYPKNMFEVIFVDDTSTDASLEIIKKATKNLEFTTIVPNNRISGSPKKDAIVTALAQAKYDWAITTDADCELPKFWLDSFDAYIQQHDVVFVAAPVVYSEGRNLLDRFQELDFLSLQGATIGGFGLGLPFLCNGANMAYTKKLFFDVDGFKGNQHIGSGDDIFMLEKVLRKFPEKTGYLKCAQAIVTTNPQPSIGALFSQRIRWAAKTGSYQNLFGKLSGIIIFLMNGALLVFLLLALAGIIKFKVLLHLLCIKFGIDFLLIFKTAQFMDRTNAFRTYLIAAMAYPFFVTFVTIASVFTGYKWKGRHYGK